MFPRVVREHINKAHYLAGGQSFGPSLLSRFTLGGRWSLGTRVDATAMVLGAINSEYAKPVFCQDERVSPATHGEVEGPAGRRARARHHGRPFNDELRGLIFISHTDCLWHRLS